MFDSHLTTSPSLTKPSSRTPLATHACEIELAIVSTASLHVFAHDKSSAVSSKLPVVRRARAGSIGSALKAASDFFSPEIIDGLKSKLESDNLLEFLLGTLDLVGNVGDVGGDSTNSETLAVLRSE